VPRGGSRVHPPGCSCASHAPRKCPEGCGCGRHAARKTREEKLETQRAWRKAHPEYVREKNRAWNEANRARVQEYRKKNGRAFHVRHTFGVELTEVADRWEAQQGLCYMCGEPLDWEAKRGFVIDHDRSHCRGKKSCGDCILGLACDACNVGCGRFGDDPDRMERAAAARRDAMAMAAARIGAKPAQGELFDIKMAARRREESA
jgi:hypothetical protein